VQTWAGFILDTGWGSGDLKSSVADSRQPCTTDDQWWWWRWAKTTSSLDRYKDGMNSSTRCDGTASCKHWTSEQPVSTVSNYSFAWGFPTTWGRGFMLSATPPMHRLLKSSSNDEKSDRKCGHVTIQINTGTDRKDRSDGAGRLWSHAGSDELHRPAVDDQGRGMYRKLARSPPIHQPVWRLAPRRLSLNIFRTFRFNPPMVHCCNSQ